VTVLQDAKERVHFYVSTTPSYISAARLLSPRLPSRENWDRKGSEKVGIAY